MQLDVVGLHRRMVDRVIGDAIWTMGRELEKHFLNMSETSDSRSCHGQGNVSITVHPVRTQVEVSSGGQDALLELSSGV